MNLPYFYALVVVGGLSIIEALFGMAKRSKGMIVIGITVAIVCALAAFILYKYGNSIAVTPHQFKL